MRRDDADDGEILEDPQVADGQGRGYENTGQGGPWLDPGEDGEAMGRRAGRTCGVVELRGRTWKLLKELRARVRRRRERMRLSGTSGNRGLKMIELERKLDRQSPKDRSAQEKKPLGPTCIEHESFRTREVRRGSRSRMPRRSMIIWMRMCGYRRRRFGPRRKKGKAS